MSEMKTERPGFWSRAIRRPTTLEVVLTVLWLLAALCELSNADIGFEPFMVLMVGALVLAGLWGLRAVLLLGRYVIKERLYRMAAPWVALPVAFAIALAATHTDIGLRLRVKFSERALLSYAQSLEPGKQEQYPSPGRRVGLFWITEAENVSGCARFITVNGFLDDYGLAYSAETEPPRVGEDFYRHLYGPWWRWHRSW
jgi:hypothetical protein